MPSELPIFAADKRWLPADVDVFGACRGPHIGVCRMVLGPSGNPATGGLPVADKQAVKRRGSGIEN